ncbi:MAG TPA: hypothetical protein VN680_07240 [Burkholderiaceae bacterium]|jgi:hypothetical protein|nr:hypothetical protein [Burkholderiaceae bacterium]
MDTPLPATPRPALSRPLARRLREIYRSAGWPSQDLLEVELLAAGLVERVRSAAGHETLRVTDAGIAALSASAQRNRAAFDPHETLVAHVAQAMQHSGRIAWCELSLRAKVGEAWVMARPDVFSVRNTTVEDYLQPIVHEVKVRRADLLADLRLAAKREAYLQIAGECSYVIAEGIAQPEEIPPECGVIVARRAAGRADGVTLECLRPAPRRPIRLPFAVWMALAKATPREAPDEAQDGLREHDHDPPPGA